MSESVRQVDYFHISVPDKPGEAFRVVDLLSKAGINLIGFCAFPHGARKSQLDFIPEDTAAFKRAARQLGLALSEKKKGFVVQGPDRSGAVAAVLGLLARKGINVTSVQAVASSQGVYGAMLWVDPADLRKASKVLSAVSKTQEPATASASPDNVVDLASENSFPASDPPPWTP